VRRKPLKQEEKKLLKVQDRYAKLPRRTHVTPG
jgi:hypothetical protein